MRAGTEPSGHMSSDHNLCRDLRRPQHAAPGRGGGGGGGEANEGEFLCEKCNCRFKSCHALSAHFDKVHFGTLNEAARCAEMGAPCLGGLGAGGAGGAGGVAQRACSSDAATSATRSSVENCRGLAACRHPSGGRYRGVRAGHAQQGLDGLGFRV